MFKDIRIKKNHASTDKLAHGSSTNLTSSQSHPNINFFNNHGKRKSVDSESSFDSLKDHLHVIKGTVTHEWGTSSTKKKNNTIIKLNNTDGTPLTSPIKMASVNSNENLDVDTLAEDKLLIIQDYKSTSGSLNSMSSQDKFELEKKRKHNRAARILSNEQFLNFQVDSPEDEKMIGKINNGNLFQSPVKKGTIMKKNNLTFVSKDSNPQLKNFGEFTDEDESKLPKEDTAFTPEQNRPSLNTEWSFNTSRNNIERSVSGTNSITSETSDVSETSQFSFQFKGRNASVKYYSNNRGGNNEMNYFDDVMGEDFDSNNGLSDDCEDEFNNDKYDIGDISDEESEDGEDHTFGAGYSTIAHISENSSEEMHHDEEEEDDFDALNTGFSSIANISEEEEDNTIDGSFFNHQPKSSFSESKAIYEEDDDESIHTPVVETINNIKKFHDLFNISDEDDETPKVVKITSNEKKNPTNHVSNYNDLFSLSEPEDEFDQISSPMSVKKGMVNLSLDDYVNEDALGALVEEMNDLIPEEEKLTFMNSSKSMLSKDALLSAPARESPVSRVTSPLYSKLLSKSPSLTQKKNYGYAQFYGMSSISAIYDDPSAVSPMVQSTNSNLVNLPPRNILKYHDLNTDLDSSIPKRMGDLFFIEEEDEDAVKDEVRSRTIDAALLGNDDFGVDDDLVLDEINEIPEDYDEEDYVENARFNKTPGTLKNKKSNASLRSGTLSEAEEDFDEAEENNIDKPVVPNRLFGKKPSKKYYKFFHKTNGLVARNDKPMSNKVSIKNKTITFFKKPSVNVNAVVNDVDLSPIQEKRRSIEDLST